MKSREEMPRKLSVAARIHLLVNGQHGSQPLVHDYFPRKSWYVVASAWKGEPNSTGRVEVFLGGIPSSRTDQKIHPVDVFLRAEWEPKPMGRAEVSSRGEWEPKPMGRAEVCLEGVPNSRTDQKIQPMGWAEVFLGGIPNS